MLNRFFFLLLIILVSCNSEDDNKGSKITEITNNNPERLLDSLSEEIVKDPGNSNNFYRRALYFYDEGEFDQALNDIQRALVSDSTVAEYHFTQGNIYYDTQRFKEAYSAYQKAINYDHEHIKAMLKLSQLELVLKNYELAIEMVNRALKLDPMNASAYFLKGFIYLDGKDTTTALSSFQTAIEVDPDYYDSYIMLAKIWLNKDAEYSEAYYNQAIEIRPESVEALYNLAVLLQDQERYLETYPIYNRILEIDSTAYFAHYNMGYVLLVTDSSYTLAIDEFENALRFYPYYHQAYCNIGLCYENLGDYKEAEKNYRKALEINPQFEPAALGLGRILE